MNELNDEYAELYSDEEYDGDTDADGREPDAAGDIGAGGDAHAPAPRSLAQMPVRLEFVLASKRVTLAEWSAVTCGQLIELPAGVERRVAVSANGVLLGYGELIQLDERMAVEMIEVYGEHNNVQ